VRSRSCAGCLIKLERGAVCNIKRRTLTPCLKRAVMYYITHFSCSDASCISVLGYQKPRHLHSCCQAFSSPLNEF
jgi:hypothetical protein